MNIDFMILYLRRKRYVFVRNVTCCKAYFHSSLPMSQHFKLRQRHFVGDAHRVWSLIPLIPDVSHCITNWINHKHTSDIKTCPSDYPRPIHQSRTIDTNCCFVFRYRRPNGITRVRVVSK